MAIMYRIAIELEMTCYGHVWNNKGIDIQHDDSKVCCGMTESCILSAMCKQYTVKLHVLQCQQCTIEVFMRIT